MFDPCNALGPFSVTLPIYNMPSVGEVYIPEYGCHNSQL